MNLFPFASHEKESRELTEMNLRWFTRFTRSVNFSASQATIGRRQGISSDYREEGISCEISKSRERE